MTSSSDSRCCSSAMPAILVIRGTLSAHVPNVTTLRCAAVSRVRFCPGGAAVYRLIPVSEAATRAARMAVRRVCALSVLRSAGAGGVRRRRARACRLRETAYKQALAGASATRILRAAFPTGTVTKFGATHHPGARRGPGTDGDHRGPDGDDRHRPGLRRRERGDPGPPADPDHRRSSRPARSPAVAVTNLDAVPEQTVTMTGPIRGRDADEPAPGPAGGDCGSGVRWRSTPDSRTR